MPINVQNPMLQQLFQPVANQQPQIPAAANQYVTKGSLIMFRYSYWIHDPVPLVIVTDYHPGKSIRGINLHYLTYPYIKTLITQSGTNMNFSYQNIKGDAYIRSSFRSYKWIGISQVKKFDSQFVLKMMTVARTFDPTQIRAIRQSVEQQIQQEVVNKAQPTQEMPYNQNSNLTQGM